MSNEDYDKYLQRYLLLNYYKYYIKNFKLYFLYKYLRDYFN